MYYSYVEIEYVATSFSPTRTDLVLKLLTPIQRSMRCSSTPQTIYLNGSALLTQLHVTKENYLTILVLWEIPKALRGSLKERTIILQILTNGQKRYCRRPNLHSHRCQELKLQR